MLGGAAANCYCFKYILKCVLHGQLCMNHDKGHVLEPCFHANAAGIITAQRGLEQHFS